MVSKGPSNTVTAESVKQKIDESLKPDNQLSIIEKNKIKELYKKVDTEEGKKDVKAYVDTMIVSDAKNDLLNLINNVEVGKKSFSMDALAKKNDSKFFGIILNNPLYVEGYSRAIIKPVIEKNMEFFPNGHDTLDVIYWKKITDEIGLKSAGGMLKDKVAGFFSGIAGKITEAGKDVTSDEMDISKMGDIVTKLSKLGEDDPKKSLLLIEKLKGYINYMTKDYTNNLNSLIELGKKEDKVGLQKLLDNPMVLDEVLKSGKYNKDGYNIDLENKKVSFNSNPNIAKSKKDFMKLAVDATNGSGGKLDAMKSKIKKFAGTLKNFGLEASDLREFRDGLKDIPLIGEFLFALVSFFLGDNLLNLMDGNPWEKEFETSGKNLQTFIKDNKEKVPFISGKEDFEDVVVSGQVESFLGKVKTANDTNFKNSEINRKISDKVNFKPGTKVSLIENEDFWKNILGKDEPNDKILKQLWDKVQEIKEKNKSNPLSTEEFFKALNKGLTIKITEKNIELTEDEKKSKVLLDIDKQKIKATDKNIISKEVEKITQFPSEVKFKTDGGVEKKLNIDFKNSKLSVNGKDFVLKDGDISDIKFNGNDVVLKIKDSAGVETEKKISKQEFAQIIAGLAVGTPVAINGLKLVTQAEKNIFLEDIKNKKDKEKIDKNKKELELEKTKLEGDIKSLNKELKSDSELNKQLTLINSEISKFKNNIKQKNDEIKKLSDTKIKNSANIKLLEEQEKESNEGFFSGIAYNIGFSDKTKIIKIAQLKNSNKEIDKNISKNNNDISNLNSKLSKKEQEQIKKQDELKKKVSDLDNKNDRFVEIEKQLGATEKELKAYNTKISEQKTQRENETKAEEARQEAERKRIEEARKSLNKAEKFNSENKAFVSMLENPKEKSELELELNDGTKIIFDKSDYSIKFGGEKFGVSNLDEKLKGVLNSFSFNLIYLTYKNDFIKVLSELKIDKKSTLKIGDKEVNFEKIS